MECQARLHQVEGVMQRLCLGRSKVFELMANGQIRSVRIGRRRLIPESAIVQFIQNLETTGSDEAFDADDPNNPGDDA
jgi:excisionase family DNA binding protein